LVGGNGLKRTLPLVARYADEWNAIYRTPAQFATLKQRLDELLAENGRLLQDVRRSMMMGLVFGRDQRELAQQLQGSDPAELRKRGLAVGTPNQLVEQLGQLAEVGVQRVMLQWPDLDDLKGLDVFAQTVLPQVQ
jgi:alkanesulfonate monooxygenase SsuD/methylene tetrahydromethanopterin reductase-like flavin-dependent oxidoreductase (luciferase family)